MRVTVLSDNNASGGLGCEWGFSALIEAEGETVLLDTGASSLFAENAQTLGIDLTCVDHAVLSHAHFDHANGFDVFFEQNDHAPLLLQAACEENCWSDAKGDMVYIGIKHGMMAAHANRLQRVEGVTEFAPDVWLVPHAAVGLESIGEREHLYLKHGDELVGDDFAHEQSLVFDAPRGITIFNSCSHAGVEVIIDEVRALFPNKPIRALVGGLHLFLRDESEVRALAAEIRDLGIERIYTGHCTGEEALAALKEELPRVVEAFYAGQVFEL